MKAKKPTKKKAPKKEAPTKLNMSFEQAISLTFAPKIKPKK
ncbi:MAG TPA: hypothetical protein PKM63_21230 [Panacibacter sp.]|nr:hypothetical protein [Panacibacter sp.]HNP46835.1 hypothetical protein [Panacibacter sp.]